jgi:hypothetical protein
MPYGGGNSHPIPSDGATALDESTDCASPTGTLFAQRGSPANPIRPSYGLNCANIGGRGRYRTADRWCVKGQDRVNGCSTVSSVSRSATFRVSR